MSKGIYETMKLMEIAVQYNKTLNPKLWDGDKLEPKVRETLLKIAKEFKDFIDIKDMKVEDIILTGSNANYNWTKQSDCDLHLVVDMKQFAKQCEDFTDDFFTDKKSLWNQNHNITIYKFPVELYVQDANEEHIATGVYSVQNDDWIKHPTYDPPSVDDSAVKAKSDHLKAEIDKVVDSKGGEDAVNAIKAKIKQMRQNGLHKGGEFSTENLAFKELRNSGYLEKLSKYAQEAEDKDLSLE